MRISTIIVLLSAFLIAIDSAGTTREDDFTSFGSMKIGTTLQQINKNMGEKFAPPVVPGADPTGNCFQVESTVLSGVYLMFIGGVLERVDIGKPNLPTLNGVSVGDPESAVERAYGSRVHSETHAYDETGKYLTVLSKNKKSGVRFEIIDGKVVVFYVGTKKAIQYIEGCA